MRITILLLSFFPFSSLADNPLCRVRQKGEVLEAQIDYGVHAYFARCHPHLPLAFSNRSLINKEGDEYLSPVMINMKTGETTPFKIPEGFHAEDMVPSPDGKFLYVDLQRTQKREDKFLGVQKIIDGKIVEHARIKIDDTTFSYPSPVYRNKDQMLLYRHFDKEKGQVNFHIDKIDMGKKELIKGVEICPELGSTSIGGIVADRPYISGDGEYFGVAVNGEMLVMKLRWDKLDTKKNSVSCDVVRKLPATTGKISFSPDNKKIVFHASRQEFLGRKISREYLPQSFIMDLETGKTMELTHGSYKKWSEFPYFCGDQGIIVREDFRPFSDMAKAVFRLLPVPNMRSNVDRCDAPVEASEKENLVKFWEDICDELQPSEMKPVYDVQVTLKNCQTLLKLWEKNKSKSQFSRQQIESACKM